MKPIRDSYKKTGRLHHAYAVLGDHDDIRIKILDFLEKDLKFPIKNNPDLWQAEFTTFKIGDSRSLQQASINKPIKFERKIFIIQANFLTKDAQNSLLKILEEPTPDTNFFLILPTTIDLITTLKSRLIIIKDEDKKNKIKIDSDKSIDADKFLRAKTNQRLLMVSQIIKNIKDEVITKNEAINFLKDLEKTIKEQAKLKKATGGSNDLLLAVEDIEKAISYANDESPSMKVILEHLALTL